MTKPEINEKIKENIGKLAKSFQAIYDSWATINLPTSESKLQDLEYIISQVRIAIWCLKTDRLQAAEHPLKEIAWPGEYVEPRASLQPIEVKTRRIYKARKIKPKKRKEKKKK